MKKIIILLVVLAAVLGISYYKSNERKSRLNRSATSVKTRELLFPDFDINGIQKVHIKDDKSEVTLTVMKDTWVILERGGFPVEKEKLQTALLSLKYEKIKAGRRIGKDSWGKVGVNAPGAAGASGTGTLVELFDDKGALKYSLVLGGQVTSSGGSSNDQMKMFGGGPAGNRFVRIPDEDTIWEISDQLPDLVTKPDAWLAKAFLDVQKLKSVEVTALKPEDSWKAARTEENGDFVLEGAKPGEKIDAGKVSLNTLLSTPTFNDVLSKDQAVAVMKDAVKARLVTFDGLTYGIQVAKQPGQGGDKYYMTVNVKADLPKERPAVKDEKPEDKKKNDEAFAEEKKRLEEKAANENKLEGWVFEVSEYTVSSLLKKRAEILAAPPPPAPAGAAAPAPGKPGGLPDVKKMIPGLNPDALPPGLAPPASPLPATPKPELKPAPAPDASPVPGVTPAEPAKPAAPAAPPADKPAAAPAAPAPAPATPAAPAPASAPADKPAEPAKPAADTPK